MRLSTALGLLGLALILGATRPAAAQNACPCDCYWNTDCETGNICSFGDLFVEDICWWRTPKPDGVPGANCDGDFNNIGRCDGKCIPHGSQADGSAGSATKHELLRETAMWGHAYTDVSIKGGGLPTAPWMKRIESVGLTDPLSRHVAWRMAAEVLILSRGADYLLLPAKDVYERVEVGVRDLSDRPGAVRNGRLAMQALLAEIDEPGTGRRFVDAIDLSAIDADLIGRVCLGEDPRACLHARIADMSSVVAGATVTKGAPDAPVAMAAGAALCGGCEPDLAPDDLVGLADLTILLNEWGATDFPPADLNQDGVVGLVDLTIQLNNWGPCAN